jgi:hypothetical protein
MNPANDKLLPRILFVDVAIVLQSNYNVIRFNCVCVCVCVRVCARVCVRVCARAGK